MSTAEQAIAKAKQSTAGRNSGANQVRGFKAVIYRTPTKKAVDRLPKWCESYAVTEGYIGVQQVSTHETQQLPQPLWTWVITNVNGGNMCENLRYWTSVTTSAKQMRITLNKNVSWIPESLARAWRTNVSNKCVNSHYFFCSTSREGTEGIRRVKNFVAFFRPYRGPFVPYVK
jgi:hypothetical protein